MSWRRETEFPVEWCFLGSGPRSLALRNLFLARAPIDGHGEGLVAGDDEALLLAEYLLNKLG